MKIKSGNSEYKTFYYNVASQFVIMFRIHQAIEYGFEYLSQIQILCLIIYKQTTLLPILGNDFFTQFTHSFTKYFLFLDLIPNEFSEGVTIFLLSFLMSFYILILYNMNAKRKTSKTESISKPLVACIGYTHCRILSIWINLILIQASKNMNDDGYRILCYIGIGMNNLIGLTTSTYSLSPMLTINEFASESRMLGFWSFCFKAILSLIFFLSESQTNSFLYSLISFAFFGSKILILWFEHPFFSFNPLRMSVIFSFLGSFLSITLLLQVITQNLSLKLNPSYIIYFEVILGPIVCKIAKNVSESYFLNSDKYPQKRNLETQKARALLLLNIDFHYSLKNINLETKDHKLIYLMKSLGDELTDKEAIENPNGNSLNINNTEVLKKLKSLRLKHEFENRIQVSKNLNKEKLLLCEIYLELFDDYQKAIFTLEGVKPKNFVENIKFKWLAKRSMKKYRKEISSSPQVVEIQKFVEVENLKEQFFEKMGNSINLQHEFLKSLVNSETKLISILESVKTVEHSCAEVLNIRKNINLFDEQIVEIMPYYSFYLASVLNQPYSAEKNIKEYDTRLKLSLTKLASQILDNFQLNDSNTILIRFSMNRETQGTILSVTENINLLGWEQKDMTKYNIVKLIPEFFKVNQKNLVDIFLEMNNEFALTSKINPIFLASSEGFLIPAELKLFLNPSSGNQIHYLAFCKILTHSDKNIVFEKNEIVGISPKVAADLHISAKDLSTIKIQNLIDCSSITGLNHDKKNLSQERESITLRHKKLTFEYSYKQSTFDIFGKSFRALTLSSQSDLTELKISGRSSSHLSERQYDENIEILEGILTTLHKADESHFSLEQEETGVKENNKLKTMNRTLKTCIQSQDNIPLESSDLEKNNSGQGHALIDAKFPTEKKMNYAESSVHSTLSSQSYKRVQNSLLFVPKKKFTIILCVMNILLFIVSSVVLLAYYFEMSSEFKLIDMDLSCIYMGVKQLQSFIETKRIANFYYLMELGVLSPLRYAPLGITLYSPVIRQYLISNNQQLENVTKNLTYIIRGFNDSVLSMYYEKAIPIRYTSRYEISTEYMDGPSFMNRFIANAQQLSRTRGNITLKNPNLKFVIFNSNDEALLQIEKIAKLAQKAALDHIDIAGNQISIYAIGIIVLGILNLILLFIRERNTRIKKRHFLNILSLLDEREIRSNMTIVSEFLQESKKTHPKTIALTYFNKYMEQDFSAEKTKKANYNGISSLKRLSSARLSLFEILKLILAMIVMVLLMVVPFLALYWAYIFSGRQEKMKSYVESQFKTGYSYYELRLLIVSSLDYYAYNRTSTLRTRPIMTELSDFSARLSYFQTYLADVQEIYSTPMIKLIISQNVCNINLATKSICESVAGGAAMRGLIGLNSFQLNTIDRIMAQFDSSKKSFSDIYLAINHPNGLISDYLDILYNFALYDGLLIAQYQETAAFVDETQLLIIRIIIGFFATNLVLGTVLTLVIQKWMNSEREIWTKIVQRIPFKIAMNSKILTAYLNDHIKRNIE